MQNHNARIVAARSLEERAIRGSGAEL